MSTQTPISNRAKYFELIDAIQNRKRTEEDMRLLANRIALLRQEEAKAMRLIEDTRKKTEMIVGNRSRNHEFRKKKDEGRHVNRSVVDQKRQQIRALREHTRQQILQKREDRKQQMDENAEQLRRKSYENENKIDDYRAELYNIKRTLHSQVNQHRQKLHQQRRNRSLQMNQRVRDNFRVKLHDEISQKNEREASIVRMEQEELELISRLQNTQFLQKSAYEDLEQALAGQIDMNSLIKDSV